ncbi:MAG: glycosyltransferase family 9 protein [Bacteroidales bacterium]|nr:glycosyltransferase family 9 protein [Bacteroidales bacterium]MCF8343894.1 glycosyltransferase family 9 protein [Bacteroidales bacterium]MCF8352358.1 glycosyltransferase family 9 protein [Bacteroidales bacterium]MCF8377480.1 glycosyltransferase family 9 protein [Bacteroidales bacterium]MCF8401603.1 glycosyltransferase family 9 protein [Bacteroidales bacterium]
MDLKKVKRIIISRTDSIGDVVLTLPVAGYLKKLLPDIEIVFLGRSYTRPIGGQCSHIDRFIDWQEIVSKPLKEQIALFKKIRADAILHVFPHPAISRLAKKAGIPLRIGTTNRLYHWSNCNKLIRLSRRNSPYHEAQLNLMLLKPFGLKEILSLDEIPKYYGLENIEPPGRELSELIDPEKFNLILHPRSKGSAREWGEERFNELIGILPEKFKIFITGTREEGEMIRKSILDKHKHIHDLTGKMTLKELIGFIDLADGLVAASTGPLHIAAALGKRALGIYPPIRPMHPGRWAPIGKKATYLVVNKPCEKCRKSMDCECIREITAEQVNKKLMEESA